MDDLHAIILGLEKRLLSTDTRTDIAMLQELIATDFEELGSSGKILSRAEVLRWLLQDKQPAQWRISDFRLTRLSPVCVHARYVASKLDEQGRRSESLRSSLWRREGTGWKIFFHQGTRVPDAP